MDRQAVHEQWDRDLATLRALVADTPAAQLRRRSRGTRWTNRQLVFHLVFGYQITRALLVLVRVSGRLPDRASRGFAAGLDAAARPFHVVNYLGSCGGGLLGPRFALWWFAPIVASLHRSLDRAGEAELARAMAFPVRWDPFFRPAMTLADVYRYPARHFAFHLRQLTIGR
ncbi:DinB family protein [Amycolatopsis sp. NPDC051102]|uniref:DinB family protein n=1 Tax=Amycolatopsis sp. NPDC051102 TaxID=3155163 RepID=UPI003424E902